MERETNKTATNKQIINQISTKHSVIMPIVPIYLAQANLLQLAQIWDPGRAEVQFDCTHTSYRIWTLGENGPGCGTLALV